MELVIELEKVDAEEKMGQFQIGYILLRKGTFVHCKKAALAIGQNRSRDFGLSLAAMTLWL